MSVALPGPRVAAVLFDLDGTLVDTLGDFHAALGAMLDELGLPPIDAAGVALRVGKGSEHLVNSVLNRPLIGSQTAPAAMESVAEHALFPAALAAYQRHYGVVNGRHARPYPGVREGLAALSARGLPMACVTNKPTAFAQALLGTLGLAGHFRAVAGGDAYPRKKPHPMPLLRLCEALGTPPAATWMVGDSTNDAQAARAAGCPVLLVPYGFNHGAPVEREDADGVVERIDALLPWWRQRGAVLG